MSDETLVEILSGRHEPSSREDLHEALDALLDAADEVGGELDGPAFWGFAASVARGRGIDEDVLRSAAHLIARQGGLPEKPQAAWRAFQWAMLSALLTRLTAFPGELAPREFSSTAFRAVAENVVAGTKGGEQIDLLGFNTQRGADWAAIARAARRQIVGVVFYRAELNGQSVAHVRRALLPDLPDETWNGWKREVAKAKGVPTEHVGDDAKAAARSGFARHYALSDAEVANLMKTAWRPNG